jgi:tRNA(adenine34) deaminase
MCAGAIFHAHFARLVWAVRDEKRGYTLLNASVLHPKTQVSEGCLAEESRELLLKFFQKRR